MGRAPRRRSEEPPLQQPDPISDGNRSSQPNHTIRVIRYFFAFLSFLRAPFLQSG